MSAASGFLCALAPVPCSFRGGILADEMGLGKTVEIIACILANRRPDSAMPAVHDAVAAQAHTATDTGMPATSIPELFCTCGGSNTGDTVVCVSCNHAQHAQCVAFDPVLERVFVCAECLSKQPPIPSRGTIIVSPASIALQWQKEIEKHVQVSVSECVSVCECVRVCG